MIELIRTTFDEIAAYADELNIGEKIVFTSQDKDLLEYYDVEPSQYHILVKMKIMYESDYVFAIGCLDGNTTIAKDINIIADGNVDDEDDRIDGLKDFVEEYYEKYMDKNDKGTIYFITGLV